MSKPSIFSKDYQKKMRRRRKRIALLIAAAVIVAAGAFLAGKNLLFSGNQQQANNTADSTTATDKTETDKTATDNTATDKTATETKETVTPVEETPVEEGFEFKLADGTAMKAVFATTGTAKKFQYVSPKEKNVYYNINPAGDKIVVFDSAAQSILLIDATGKVQDITNPSYTSSKGTVYKKENVLSSYSNYIWCSSPAFISDTKVAYISQLPYFQKTTQYVWIVDVATNKNTKINDAYSGNKITFGKLEAKGLMINIDEKVFYITPAGSVVK